MLLKTKFAGAGPTRIGEVLALGSGGRRTLPPAPRANRRLRHVLPKRVRRVAIGTTLGPTVKHMLHRRIIPESQTSDPRCPPLPRAYPIKVEMSAVGWRPRGG